MKFTHKGYTLVQDAMPINYHYMIFNEDGHMVMHAQYDKPITEEKARELIDFYISFAGISDKVIDEMLKDEEETDI